MLESKLIQQLQRNKEVFSSLLSTINPDMIHWRPAENKWSLLEIVCHLYDEEREDFRARIQSCFDRPEQAFVPIDPQGWVESRNYADQDYQTKVQAFLAEREHSIVWLQQLTEPNWVLGIDHQHFGRMSATMLLHNWLAHDYLHIRQIVRYHFMFLQSNADVSLEYAGVW